MVRGMRPAGTGLWPGRVLMMGGGALLLVGAVVGWLAPRNTALLGWLPALGQVATGTLDVSGFLSAAITALAVIIAVVIGFNATSLQIAGQAHALMSKALQLLTDAATDQLTVTLDLLRRVIGAVDWPEVRGGRRDAGSKQVAPRKA